MVARFSGQHLRLLYDGLTTGSGAVVAHLLWEQEVGGSSPLSPTDRFDNGPLEVGGSSPTTSRPDTARQMGRRERVPSCRACLHGAVGAARA